MKVKVKIEGLVDVPVEATEDDIKDALYLQIGFGSMAVDNPVGEPDWVSAEVEVSLRAKKNHELNELNEFMERPKRERLIIDNRSSRPLYEAYEQAFNFYFEEWCEEYDTQAMTWNGFVFYMRTNKDSITIQIYDDKNKQ